MGTGLELTVLGGHRHEVSAKGAWSYRPAIERRLPEVVDSAPARCALLPKTGQTCFLSLFLQDVIVSNVLENYLKLYCT